MVPLWESTKAVSMLKKEDLSAAHSFTIKTYYACWDSKKNAIYGYQRLSGKKHVTLAKEAEWEIVAATEADVSMPEGLSFCSTGVQLYLSEVAPNVISVFDTRDLRLMTKFNCPQFGRLAQVHPLAGGLICIAAEKGVFFVSTRQETTCPEITEIKQLSDIKTKQCLWNNKRLVTLEGASVKQRRNKPSLDYVLINSDKNFKECDVWVFGDNYAIIKQKKSLAIYEGKTTEPRAVLTKTDARGDELIPQHLSVHNGLLAYSCILG